MIWVGGLRRNVGCWFCGRSWWAPTDSDTVSMVMDSPLGFTWWHTDCVEWCDWKWEVSREERGHILTALTRFSETIEGGYR